MSTRPGAVVNNGVGELDLTGVGASDLGEARAGGPNHGSDGPGDRGPRGGCSGGGRKSETLRRVGRLSATALGPRRLTAEPASCPGAPPAGRSCRPPRRPAGGSLRSSGAPQAGCIRSGLPCPPAGRSCRPPRRPAGGPCGHQVRHRESGCVRSGPAPPAAGRTITAYGNPASVVEARRGSGRRARWRRRACGPSGCRSGRVPSAAGGPPRGEGAWPASGTPYRIHAFGPGPSRLGYLRLSGTRLKTVAAIEPQPHHLRRQRHHAGRPRPGSRRPSASGAARATPSFNEPHVLHLVLPCFVSGCGGR